MAQFRVQCGSGQGEAWLSTGCTMAQLKGAAIAQLRVWHGSAPDYTIKTISIFFSKFAEIFTAQGSPLVSNGKNLQSEKFSLYLLDTFG
jgi:hypothetical protein